MNQSFIPNRPSPSTNGRLMLCNIGRLGDTILRNSILDSAFRTYATVDYICGPSNAELIRGDSRLNEVIVWRNTIAGMAGLLNTALRHHYDGFIELKDHRSWTSLWIARLFRSKVKTGWNSNHLRPYHRDIRGVCGPDAHKTETMRRIGELAGLKTGEYKASLILTSDSINWFRRNYTWQKPYIFLNLSATGADRRWPVDHWARYVQGCGLANESILVNGIPEDREMVNQLCAKLPGAVAFQPRQFMDVAAALLDARLVLTVDTGVVHASSALDKPIVALYAAGTNVTKYEPLSNRKLVIRANGPMTNLEPEQAVAETLRHGLP